MITHNLIRYLMSDSLSLDEYTAGHHVSVDEIRRHLMLLAMEKDYHIPDSMYLLMSEMSIGKDTSLPTLLSVDIPNYAIQYLMVCGEKIMVKAESFNDWQMQLCWWSPLVLESAMIASSFPATDTITEYMHKHVLPNFRYTALPSPHIIQMESMKRRNKGFVEEHLHLNGTLETDIVWQDIMENPDYVFEEVNNVYEHDEKVQEMFDQLLPNLTPTMLHDNWLKARRMRCQLLNLIIGKSAKEPMPFENEHPLLNILGVQCGKFPALVLESMLMVMIFHYLSMHRNDESVARLFHNYLLILGQTNRLLVQNNRMYGFREFQKYTLVGVREYSEKYYRRRFLQMAGNNSDNCRYIEGRFSPKDSEGKNEWIISHIVDAFNLPNAKLSLIAHFIKEPDNGTSDIRHENFRNKLRQRAEVLCSMIKSNHPLARKVVGVDAAANELDASPEVFSAVYAMARDAGMKHFTYHAGEDFYHIISGLRSVYEAITFLQLQRGDRVGHAVACGIDPHLWYLNMGETILMRKGDYMDSLIVMYELISEEATNDSLLISKMPLLERRISQFACEVYDENVGISLLVESWKLRSKNPTDIINKTNKTKVEKLFQKYHSRYYKKNYEEIISVETLEIFNIKELELLQLALLKKMHREEIVIETLPTSNVIIGHHHDFSSYHIYRWYRWQLEGNPIPPIVVGTDDAGIFATNIYNEYCHIYTLLTLTYKETYQNTMKFIRWLDDNANVYSFDGASE